MTTSQAPNIFEDAPRSPTKPSVLRAMLSPKNHKKTFSTNDATPLAAQQGGRSEDGTNATTMQLPLAERAPNRDVADGAAPNGRPMAHEEKRGLHKKTKSAVSLKSLKSYMERNNQKPDGGEEMKPKKAKSSNSLAAILKRPQREKNEGTKEAGNKENCSPERVSEDLTAPGDMQSEQRYAEEPIKQYEPEKQRSLRDEVSLYTPKGYSPAQQRNFYGYHQPSLARPSEPKPRPKSEFLGANRKMKDFLSPQAASSSMRTAEAQDGSPSKSHQRSRTLSRPRSYPEKEPAESKSKASRVQAAISIFNAKEQDTELQAHLDSKELESDFEKLLVSMT